MQRIELVRGHLKQNKTANTGSKSPDDVVICAAVRTPLTRAKRGPLRDTPGEIVVSHVIKAIQEKTGVKYEDIGDITFGNVLQGGSANFPTRIGQFLAGVPYTVPLVTINRLCSSGLEACAQVAAKIKAGIIDVGLAGGHENMTHFSMNDLLGRKDFMAMDAIEKNENAKNCLLGMGITSELVAEKFGVTREQCDNFAFESQRKALEAQKKGLFKDEIVPIKVTVQDKQKDGTIVKKEVLVEHDDGIRETTMDTLTKLPSAFKKGGVSTAGNSSQTTEGAAAVLLAKRSVAEKLGLPIIAKWVSYAVAGVPPEVMGIGPAFAIPKALEKAGLKKEDVDIYEINEAFATQALYSIEKLGLDKKKVNPQGGAIALGHPLGATGARMVATILPELRRAKGKYGVISMCIGTGMGAAAVLELEK